MKFYLAARYSRRDELIRYARELESMGHEITASWLTDFHPFIEGMGLTPVQAIVDHGWVFGDEDIKGIEACDVFVAFTDLKKPDFPTMITPEQYVELGRGGRHVELGIAIGLGKTIVLVGPLENVFQQYIAEPRHELSAAAAFLRWADAAPWFAELGNSPQPVSDDVNEKQYQSLYAQMQEGADATDHWPRTIGIYTTEWMTGKFFASDPSSWGTKDSGAREGNSGGDPRFKALLDEAWDLHRRKSRQYASDQDPLENLHAHTKMGYAPYDACMIEVQNIATRIRNLVRRMKNGEDVYSALRDALMDMAAFSYLGIITLDEDSTTH